MKIVMVSLFPEDPEQIRGGVAGVTVYLTQALRKIPGLEIEVVVPYPHKSSEQTVDFDGMKVHFLPRGLPGGSIINMLFGQSRSVRRKLAELDFDLVHIQGYCLLAGQLDVLRVLTIHGIQERDALFHPKFPRLRSMFLKCVEGYWRKRSQNTIVISPYVRDVLAKELRGKTWDIENPVRDDFFKITRQTIPGRVLFGGTIHPRKNIKGLLEAFALVGEHNSQAKLRLAGTGVQTQYGQECIQLSSHLGLEGRVNFLGNLSVKDLQMEMANAACLVLCSFQETAPVIIEEATATGLPVVASDICGIPYMVEDGVTGRLVNPADAENIAEGIIAVLDEETNHAMSVRSREIAESRFRASTVAQKTFEVYQDILEKKDNKA